MRAARHPFIDLGLGSTRQRLAKARLVLLPYPVVAIVAIICLTGGGLHWDARGFFIACLLYPAVFFGCSFAAHVLQCRHKRVAALIVSGVPVQYAVLVGFAAMLLILFERAHG